MLENSRVLAPVKQKCCLRFEILRRGRWAPRTSFQDFQKLAPDRKVEEVVEKETRDEMRCRVFMVVYGSSYSIAAESIWVLSVLFTSF